jgi:hypothetical protein
MVRSNGWPIAGAIGYRISSELGQHLGHFFSVGIGLDQFLQATHLALDAGQTGAQVSFLFGFDALAAAGKTVVKPEQPGFD